MRPWAMTRRALSADGHRHTVQPFPRRATLLWRRGNVLAHGDHRPPITVSLPCDGGDLLLDGDGLLRDKDDRLSGRVNLLRGREGLLRAKDDRLPARVNLLRGREGFLHGREGLLHAREDRLPPESTFSAPEKVCSRAKTIVSGPEQAFSGTEEVDFRQRRSSPSQSKPSPRQSASSLAKDGRLRPGSKPFPTIRQMSPRRIMTAGRQSRPTPPPGRWPQGRRVLTPSMLHQPVCTPIEESVRDLSLVFRL
jgi:hypothetical protein